MKKYLVLLLLLTHVSIQQAAPGRSSNVSDKDLHIKIEQSSTITKSFMHGKQEPDKPKKKKKKWKKIVLAIVTMGISVLTGSCK